MSFPKTFLWSAASIGLLVPAALLADLDKEKKDAEDAEKAKVELGEDEHEAYHDRLAQEGEKNLEEINKLLDEIQKNLGSKDTGAATQARQKQVVERLEKLIKELEKGCSSCGASPDANQKSQKQQIAGKKPKQESPRQKQRAEDEKEGKKKQQAQQQKPDKEKLSEKEKKGGRVENERVEDGDVPKAESGKLAEALNEAKRWGILPTKVAESMLSAGGKEVPPEYREIISRYYKRMTEIQAKGR